MHLVHIPLVCKYWFLLLQEGKIPGSIDQWILKCRKACASCCVLILDFLTIASMNILNKSCQHKINGTTLGKFISLDRCLIFLVMNCSDRSLWKESVVKDDCYIAVVRHRCWPVLLVLARRSPCLQRFLVCKRLRDLVRTYLAFLSLFPFGPLSRNCCYLKMFKTF